VKGVLAIVGKNHQYKSLAFQEKRKIKSKRSWLSKTGEGATEQKARRETANQVMNDVKKVGCREGGKRSRLEIGTGRGH